jgi:putative transcriptional regulator
MGFVLNKPLKRRLNDFFPELKELPDIPLFQGGPVGMDRVFFIHTLGDTIPGTENLGDGLYFDGDFDMIKTYIMEGNPVDNKVKFFLGYSGWDQNQLEHEISRNSWLVSRPDKARAMSVEGEISWKKALYALGDKYKSWANFPKRPFMN